MYFGPGSWVVESGILGTPLGMTLAGVFIAHWLVMIPLVFNRAVKEDEVLKKEFGAQWQSWAQRTRYRVIPFIF